MRQYSLLQRVFLKMNSDFITNNPELGLTRNTSRCWSALAWMFANTPAKRRGFQCEPQKWWLGWGEEFGSSPNRTPACGHLDAICIAISWGSAVINMFMLAVWGTSPKMGVRVGWGGREWYQSKASPWFPFPNTSPLSPNAYLQRFSRN